MHCWEMEVERSMTAKNHTPKRVIPPCALSRTLELFFLDKTDQFCPGLLAVGFIAFVASCLLPLCHSIVWLLDPPRLECTAPKVNFRVRLRV